jgi:4-amino-4-deoxy-L-arabinose transferase-like glycosyltransferase
LIERARDVWRGLPFSRRLAAIVGLGAVWRYAYLIAAKRNQPLLLNDSLYYSWQAAGLTKGVYFKDIYGVNEAAEHGPLTSIVLAPVSWGSHVVFQQRFVTATLGIVTVAVIGLVGRRIGGDRIGLIAAGVAAAYPNLWINDGLVMSESLGGVLVGLILLATLWLLRDREDTDRRARLWRALLLGGLLGLGILNRSELAVAVPLAMIVVATWLRPRRDALVSAGVIAVASAIVVAPWIVYNVSRFQENVLLSTNDGTTLIGANCPETYSTAALGGWSLFCVLDVQGPPGADASVRAKVQRDTALSYARHHLGRLPLVAVGRVARTLDVFKLDNLVLSDVGEEKARWAVWAGIASWWLLAPLAAFGLTRTDRRTRHVLLIPIVTVFVTSVAFYGSHRLRSTLEPAVVLAAAVAIGALTQRRDDQAGDTGLPGRSEGPVGLTDGDPAVR